MRAAIAALCAALLLVPASVAVGYNLGKPSAPAPDRAAVAAERFLKHYNDGNTKAICRMLDARYWYAYMGFVSPGACPEQWTRGPQDVNLRVNTVGVAHLDGNTAIVTLRAIPKPQWKACDKHPSTRVSRDECEASIVFIQLTLELSRRLPSSEYDAKKFRPLAKPKGKRVLEHGRWQVVSVSSV